MNENNNICCGMHEVCEKEELLRAAVKPIEYYDDEELDAYAGTAADDYTDAQTAAFRYVFDTMMESDVPGWLNSLQLRGIELPNALKDEVLLIISQQ
jgi:hypothetical protein